MPAFVHDFPATVSVAAGHYAAAETADVTGPTVDLGGDGPCFAIQQVGDVSGDDISLAGRLEQSADGTTWTAIPGATFTAVTGAAVQEVIGFSPTARYVRWAAAITGTTPSFTVAVVLGQQKKTF